MTETPGEYRANKKSKLNGWQRLWIVVTVPWLLFVVARMVEWLVVKGYKLDGEIVLYIIAPFAVYVLVLVTRRIVLWVIEGFRDV